MSVRPRVFPVVDIAAAQEGVVLTVCGDGLSEPFRLEHGRAHQLRRLHAVPVVRKAADLRGHVGHVGELGALLPARYRAVGQYVYDGVTLYYVQLLRECGCVLRHGTEVRHGADGGVAAPRGSLGAGFYRLLIRKTRLSKMYMHIDKTGNNKTIIKITNTYALTGNDTGLNTGDDAVQNLNVGGNKDPLTEDLAAFYDDAAHQKNPLSDTLRARKERGLKFFYYFTPTLKFCQRPKPKIAPSRSISAIYAPFPAVCTKLARPRGTTVLF